MTEFVNLTQRPFAPDTLRRKFQRVVATLEVQGIGLGPNGWPVLEAAASRLTDDPLELTTYLDFVTGIPFLEDMSEAHIVALLRLWGPDGAACEPSAIAKQEARWVIEAVTAGRESDAG